MNPTHPHISTLVPPPTTAAATGLPSFSLQNRLARSLWNLVYILLFRPSPRPLHAWRASLLRLFGARIGNQCHIYPKARIWAPWNLHCQDHAAIADDVIVYNQALISLGQGSIVSQGSHLCTGTHNYLSPNFELVTHPITILDQAWVCADCFISPGITIGQGSVIGARSVVTKNMPPWTVCAGHPCQPIKPRHLHEG